MATGPEKPVGSPSSPDHIVIRRSHLYLALLPISFGIGIAYGYLLWGRSSSAEGTFSNAAVRVEVDPGDNPALGPLDAPIELIEFGDFNCPHCQRWHNEVYRELLATYPDQIRFTYVDFPIVGGGAIGFEAAQAANCAGEQGAYWDYHDALLSGGYPLDAGGFQAAASELGLNGEGLMACIESRIYAEEVQADLQYGTSIGVSGTPTFFINGIPMIGAQPLLRFVEVINVELGQ